MRARPLGNVGVSVGEVGLGTWQFGGDWGDVSEEGALATMRAAFESGTTFFDTADVYGLGRSETLIGRFLKDHRCDIFVATKLGRFPDPGGPENFSLESFRRFTQASCERLGVSALDLTQLHCIPTEHLRRGDAFDWLRTLQREGLILHFGASVESMEEALLCLEQEGLSSLQIIFNVFRQKPIEALFERAKERGVAIIVRLPLASGLLSGKYTKETTFAPQDHRTYNRDGEAFNVGETFGGLPFETGVDLADQLKPMVPSSMTMAQWAVRWCLDFDAVSAVIPGARNPEQACANAAASDFPPLSEETHQTLRAFYEEQVKPHIRGPY